MASTYRDMTVEHLGSDATPADLELFQRACRTLVERNGMPEDTATDVVWNGGNWYVAALARQ